MLRRNRLGLPVEFWSRLVSIAAVFLLLLSPQVVFAYVGPGAGVSALGSLWGLIVAIIFVLFGLLFLPVKILVNRWRKRTKLKAEGAEAHTGDSNNTRQGADSAR